MQQDVIARFFETFHRDWPAFRALWTDDPVMAMPFAPPGFERRYAGAAFDAFWYPVFHLMKGRFDWTVNRIEALPGGAEYLVFATSEVDVMTDGRSLRYDGEYVQLFRLEGSHIAQLTEYFDSHRMAVAYGIIGQAEG